MMIKRQPRKSLAGAIRLSLVGCLHLPKAATARGLAYELAALAPDFRTSASPQNRSCVGILTQPFPQPLADVVLLKNAVGAFCQPATHIYTCEWRLLVLIFCDLIPQHCFFSFMMPD